MRRSGITDQVLLAVQTAKHPLIVAEIAQRLDMPINTVQTALYTLLHRRQVTRRLHFHRRGVAGRGLYLYEGVRDGIA